MSLNRETTIIYLGHATVLIETPKGTRILIDPWTISNPACPPEWKATDRLGRIDLILLTHLHNDHVGDAEAIVQAYPDTIVIGIFEACNWISKKGAKHTRPMNKGGSQTIAEIEITMT